MYGPARPAAGAASLVQLVPPLVVLSSAVQRLDPQANVPSAKPRRSDTNVIDSTWKLDDPVLPEGGASGVVEREVVGVAGADSEPEVAVAGPLDGEDEPPAAVVGVEVPHPASARTPTAKTLPKVGMIIFWVPGRPCRRFMPL